MAQFFKPKPKAINKKHQELLVTKLDYQGVGIGHLGKLTTFVSGALPGERVLVQITQQKKNVAKAKLIKRLSSSEKRTEPLCPHFSACGGCSLQYLAHEDQLDLKEQGLLSLLLRANPELDEHVLKQRLQDRIVSSDKHYRRSVRLSIFKGKLGFREEASKNIIDIASCPILVTALNELLPDLRRLLLSMQSPLGHLELIEADNTRVVYLRANKKLIEREKQELITWCEAQEISCYIAEDSDDMQHLYGEEPYYLIDGVQIRFLPRDFIQVNADVNRAMVEQAMSWLEVNQEDRVLDLFCGLGNFSLPLAKRAQEVVGVEGVDVMVERASKNAELNNLNNVTFHQANLLQGLADRPWIQQGFSKVLLDPARAGASGVMQHIADIEAQKILYVSCNPVTLASDVKALFEAGYQLQKIGILDMFPHTGHIESMLLFAK